MWRTYQVGTPHPTTRVLPGLPSRVTGFPRGESDCAGRGLAGGATGWTGSLGRTGAGGANRVRNGPTREQTGCRRKDEMTVCMVRRVCFSVLVYECVNTVKRIE